MYSWQSQKSFHLSHDWNRARFRKVELALLRTCRQIYIEAVDVLYGSNVIHVEHSRDLIGLVDSDR